MLIGLMSEENCVACVSSWRIKTLKSIALTMLMLSLVNPPVPNVELASVLEGEVLIGGCPPQAAIVAARVWDNRGSTGDGWYGWREPSDLALTISAIYRLLPDESQGAQFFIERNDKKKMPFLDNAVLVGEWRCLNGNVVQAWLL